MDVDELPEIKLTPPPPLSLSLSSQRKIVVYDRNGRLFEEIQLPPQESNLGDPRGCGCSDMQARGSAGERGGGGDTDLSPPPPPPKRTHTLHFLPQTLMFSRAGLIDRADGSHMPRDAFSWGTSGVLLVTPKLLIGYHGSTPELL